MGKIYEIVHPRELVGYESISLASSLQLPSRSSAHPRQSVTVQESSSSMSSLRSPVPATQDPPTSTASSLWANQESATLFDSSSIVTAALLDQENVEESSSQGAKVKSKVLRDSGTDLEHFHRNFSFEIAENEENHSVIPAFVGQMKCDVVELRQKCSNNDAYIVFDKMPESFLSLKLSNKATFKAVSTELFKGVDLINFTFDPGGECHKSKFNNCDKIVFEFEQCGKWKGSFGGIMIGGLKGNEMVAEGIKLSIQQWDSGGRKEGSRRAAIDEPLVIAIYFRGRKEECELTAEFVGLLQSRPSKIVVFDPGGVCEGRKCLLMEEFIHLLEVPIHWDPGG